MQKIQLVIFDLDGTLLNTSEGIFNSVRYAEKKLKLQPIEENRLQEFVGPPPKKMYKLIYNLDEVMAQKAVQFHREYGKNQAIYEAKVYDGILETLRELKERGYKLGVATLKSQTIANNILNHFDLSSCFDVIIGMDDEETLTKAKTIEIVMQQLNISETKKVVLIGDSEYDLIGAREVGVWFIPALYGFGFNSAVSCNNVIKNINHPTEMLAIL